MEIRLTFALLASAAFVTGSLVLAQPGLAAGADVPVVADGIGGVVTGAKGPEAGVWVIAETEDTPTRFIKIVVTDDQGRFLIPELPKHKYKVWVRGYGLTDSQAVEGTPGKSLNLKALAAPDARTAAEYYPANYWLSMIDPPAASEFPGTGPKGNGIAPTLKTQQEWTAHMAEGCMLCHQLGDKTTRELADNTSEGWAERIQRAREDGDAAVGNLGKSYSHDMQNNMTRYGTQRGLSMFASWTQKIQKGDVPKETPPRPAGIERNAVITVWDWANGGQIHDEISTDRRNPSMNGNGRVYGVSPSTGFIQWLDPVKNESGQVGIPGEGTDHDINAYPHNPMLDQKGRLWATDSSRGRQINSAAEKGVKIDAPLGMRADFCTNPANKFAKVLPMPGKNVSGIILYDPASKKVENISACYGTHHLAFGYDKDNTLYFSGGGDVYGWINTRVYDETKDLAKAEGWCGVVLDTSGDGKITPDSTQWNKPGQPVDAKKDTQIRGGGYGMDAHPKDGSVWYGVNSPAVPSGIARFSLGNNPPETCMTEYYEPPMKDDGKTYVAYDARGMGVDTNGLVHATFGSGKIATFDRSKCKVTRGPTATGQQCPEGWAFYDVPGPRIGNTDVSADWFYLNWVDTYDTLGLGANVPLTVGSNSDSLIAMLPKTNQVVHFRVPYPLGSFYSRGMDGRIDNPKTGWKGRGIWASQGKFPVWHQEGGDEGKGPQLIKFQVRPDPLAH